jgi:hypothetical protein
VTDTVALADRITDAQKRLHDALLDGSDTGEIHVELAALRGEQERAFAAEAEAAAKAEAERERVLQERIEAAATSHVANAMRRIEQRLAALAPPAPASRAASAAQPLFQEHPEMADTQTADPALDAAALRLAQAEIAAHDADEALAAAAAERDRIGARIADLDRERREVGRRRQEGDLRDTDGAQLALAAADIEALAAILGEKDAIATDAGAAAEQARRALDAARHGFEREQNLREEAALTGRMEQLDLLLREAIGQANGVSKRLGRGKPVWVPTKDLVSLLTPLDLGRPWL